MMFPGKNPQDNIIAMFSVQASICMDQPRKDAMQIDTHSANDVLTLHVREDRLDAAVATAFKDQVRASFGCAGRTIILDLAQVDFMDSSGLGAMIAVLKSLPAGRSLMLRGLTPNVWRVFQLTRMDQVFTILDRDTAAAAIVPSGGHPIPGPET